MIFFLKMNKMNNKTLFKQSVSDNKNLMTGWSTRVLYFFKKINLGWRLEGIKIYGAGVHFFG
jgi:hypothetical protein